MLGLDPLYVANEGAFIAVADQSIAGDVSELLKKSIHHPSSTIHHPSSIIPHLSSTIHHPPSIIGSITSDHPGKVILNSRIGGKRVVNLLPGEQLPRIC
jgi:hydrogenase expression/formation protein HypE